MVTTYVRSSGAAPEGTPQAFVRVLVVQPDGTPGDEALTDEQGNATVHGVLPGAAISAAYPERNFSTHVTSILGVAPGDHLAFGDNYDPVPDPQEAGSMAVTVPPFPGATVYESDACSRSNGWPHPGTLSVLLSTGCVDATGPILVMARDPDGGVLASGYFSSALLVPNTTLQLPAWTPNASVTTSISGLSSEIVTLQLDNFAVYDPAMWFGFSSAWSRDQSTAMMIDSLPATARRIVGKAQLGRDDDLGAHDTFRAVPGTATELMLAAPALPWVSRIATDLATGRVTWVQTAGSYDAAVATLSWSHLETTGIEHDHTWTVIAPPAMTSLDFAPALAVTVPMVGDHLSGALVELVDIPTVPSYDALRGLPEWQIVNPGGAVFVGDLAGADVAVAN